MSDEIEFSGAELKRRMTKGWDDFQAYLSTLTPAQITEPTDAAGWTAKDHIMHLAVWEDGIAALLNQQSRYEAMGVDRELFLSGDHDRVNAIIQQRHKDMPLDAVLETLSEVHGRLMAKLETMSDDELKLPYQHYAPDANRPEPVWHWVGGNTYEHYAEHQPWIAAIVESH